MSMQARTARTARACARHGGPASFRIDDDEPIGVLVAPLFVSHVVTVEASCGGDGVAEPATPLVAGARLAPRVHLPHTATDTGAVPRESGRESPYITTRSDPCHSA
mgnify:CR=1 FL=1